MARYLLWGAAAVLVDCGIMEMENSIFRDITHALKDELDTSKVKGYAICTITLTGKAYVLSVLLRLTVVKTSVNYLG